MGLQRMLSSDSPSRRPRGSQKRRGSSVKCWHGGDHTNLKVRKAKTGRHRWALDGDTTDLIRGLARLLPDWSMASLLNRSGKATGRGNT